MQVLRAYTVPVTADGQTQEIITTGATTRDLLTQAGLTYTEEDYLTPAADETVPEGSSVTLQRVSYVEYTEDETVPSEVEEIPCITANRTKCRWSSMGQMAWTL